MCSKEESKDCQEIQFRNSVLNFLDKYPLASFLYWMFENHQMIMIEFIMNFEDSDDE